MRKWLSTVSFWHKQDCAIQPNLNDEKIRELLIKGDFSFTLSNKHHPLHPYLSSKQFVLEHTFTVKKFTLWHILAALKEKEHFFLLDTLLDRYRDLITPDHLNQMATNGLTPCHEAALEANIAALRLLVKYGADPTIPTKIDNMTLLELAKKYHSDKSNCIQEIEKIIAEYPKISLATNQKTAEKHTTSRKRHSTLLQQSEGEIDLTDESQLPLIIFSTNKSDYKLN